MINIKNIKVLLLVLALLGGGVLACAASPYKDAGTSASAFLKLGTGAPEAQALGNAYTALSKGTQALFWNPAGAATSNAREVQLSYMQWYEGVGDYALGYIQPMGKTVIGVTMRYMTVSDIDFRGIDGTPQNYSGDAVRDLVAGVSLARTFFGALDLGATAKYINEDNAGTKNTNAAFDIGAKLRLLNNKLLIGAMGQNLGDEQEVPTAVRGGAAIESRYFTLSGELVKYNDDRTRFGIGLALHIPEDIVQVATFDLRVGYYNRESTGFAEEGSMGERFGLDTTSKITLGFGFYSGEIFGYGVGLDYAMMPSGALGTAHQLAVRMQF